MTPNSPEIASNSATAPNRLNNSPVVRAGKSASARWRSRVSSHWASGIAKERRSRPDGHESLRIRKRQRPQDYCVNDTENGRVRPDAQREREHGHGGEAGVLQQLAEGEFQIIHISAPPSDRLSRRAAPAASKPGSSPRISEDT